MLQFIEEIGALKGSTPDEHFGSLTLPTACRNVPHRGEPSWLVKTLARQDKVEIRTDL